MKILMAADSYPPRIGGLGKHVQMLSRGLVSRGHRVTVFTIGYPDLPGYEEANGVKVRRLPGFFQRLSFLYKDAESKKPPPVRDWLVLRELRRIAREEKPDIIHAHGWILYSTLPLKNDFKTPLVATLHDYGLICPKNSLLMREFACDKPFTARCLACGREQYGIAKSLLTYLAVKLNRGGLGPVDRFIAVSSFVRDVHMENLRLGDKCVVIPNFYAPGITTNTDAHSDLPGDFVLFIGNFTPSKGVNVLIEASRRLDVGTKLVLIGARHPDYRYSSGEDILVIENAPSSWVTEAYQKCRFAVFPSIWPEPCPTVAFEAMSHKKAVIGTSTGGFTDIVVDRETGLLVPPNDVKALSEAMNYLLANPTAAMKMGEMGYKRWEQLFTTEAVVPKIEALYWSLL